MKYAWLYTKKATKDLRVLDQKTARRIANQIRSFCSSQDPMVHAKPLMGIFGGLFRFRVGSYRIIFRKQSRGRLIILLILRIKHRIDVYE